MSEKTVLITGTTTGIGLAAARLLDAVGWKVYAGVLPGESTDALKGGTSPRLVVVPLDITKPEQVTAVGERLAKELPDGALHGLVNNAGIAVPGALEVLPMAALRQQMEVNVFGHVQVTQTMLPLIRSARGRIVNTVSILGRVSSPLSGAYCMSKYAMEAFSDTLRQELAPWGIEVSAIEPGFINTPIWGKAQATTNELRDELSRPGRELYDALYTRMEKMMGQSTQGASDPQVVAEAILHALSAPRPKTRYLVGSNARVIAFLRWLLPDRLLDSVLQRQYTTPR
jgi:NAD(P)-dependent dehydrogenase (short-subunit alcohol dehydrogenase family)